MTGSLLNRVDRLEKARGDTKPHVIVASSPTETCEDARVRLGLADAGNILLVYTGVPRAENWQ